MEGWDIALLRMLPPPCELSDQGANIVALMDWVDAARPLLRLRATSRRLQQCAAPHFDSWATQYSASGLGPTLFDTLCGDTWHRTGLSGVCCGTTPRVRRALCSLNLDNGSEALVPIGSSSQPDVALRSSDSHRRLEFAFEKTALGAASGWVGASSVAELDPPFCHRCDGVIPWQEVAVGGRCYNLLHTWRKVAHLR